MRREHLLVVAGTGLIAGTYGLVRLAYGLFLPDIEASLALGPRLAGLVSSGGSVAYCIGALAGLTASARRRQLVLGALLAASLGAVGMASATSTAVFVPAAVVASAGAGLASPGLVAMVERNVSSARRDRAQATVNAGTGPGLVAAGILALLLLPHWRLGFAAAAVLTAAAGVVVLLADRPGSADGHGTERPTGRPFASGRLLLLGTPAVAAVLLGAGSAVVWTYGRTQLVEQGASDAASTVAWVALGAGGTATVLTSRLLVRLRPSTAWFLTAAVVAGAIVVLGVAAGSLATGLLACAVFGWGYVAASSALIAWAAEALPGDAALGTSALFIALVVGQAGGASAAGTLTAAHGLTAAFLVSATVAALAVLPALARPTRLGEEEPALEIAC